MADPTWLPTTADVAAKMARFLPDVFGDVDGDDFATDRSPTRAQAETIIRTVGLSIAAAAGANLTDDLTPVAADAVSYRAAARIIASFYPEANLDFVKLFETWADEALASISLASGAGGDAEVEFVDIVEFRPGCSPELAERPFLWL